MYSSRRHHAGLVCSGWHHDGSVCSAGRAWYQQALWAVVQHFVDVRVAVKTECLAARGAFVGHLGV